MHKKLFSFFLCLCLVIFTTACNELKKANVGDLIILGTYPQTVEGNEEPVEWEAQPIEWQILAKEKNRMFLISRYGLDARAFDDTSNNWEDSEIRQWLNGFFYNKAFSDKEKKMINSFEGDKVFFLSKEEAEGFFDNSESRQCKPTKYAVIHKAYVNSKGYSYWWLRSSHCDLDNCVCAVGGSGNLDHYCYVYDNVGVVRPALWINI